MTLFTPEILAVIFVVLVGVSAIMYAMLDGYDLGVGILLPMDGPRQADRNIMIASIGPFWDANETWLVLAIGLVLIAFPKANSLMLYHLYLPTLFLLIGLILRGVAFDFRTKAVKHQQALWEHAFKYGSLLAALSQGYMLGQYVVGFESTPLNNMFSLLSAVGVTAGYAYIGGCWLVMKTEGDLQAYAIKRTIWAGRATALGIGAVCLVNPLVNDLVLARWFTLSPWTVMWVIPILCFGLLVQNDALLRRLPLANDAKSEVPFLRTVAIFILAFAAIAFSFFPYIVPGQLTIFEAASAPEALTVILIGAVLVLPFIFFYTFVAYKTFRGKATELEYTTD